MDPSLRPRPAHLLERGEDETQAGEGDSFHDSVMFAITGRMSAGSPKASVRRRPATVGDPGALHMDDLRAALTKHDAGAGIYPSAPAETTTLPFRAEWRAGGVSGAHATPRDEPAQAKRKDEPPPGETSAERESKMVEAELSRKLSKCEEELRASQVARPD